MFLGRIFSSHLFEYFCICNIDAAFPIVGIIRYIIGHVYHLICSTLFEDLPHRILDSIFLFNSQISTNNKYLSFSHAFSIIGDCF